MIRSVFFIFSLFSFFAKIIADERYYGERPAIILVPGAFHSAEAYGEVVDQLHNANYDKVLALDLPSFGHLVDRDADINAVVVEIEKLVDAGRDVVLVGNSYGCTVIGEAVQGFTSYPVPGSTKTRPYETQKGRILGLIFLAGFVPYISEVADPSTHPDIHTISPPFFRFTSDGKVYSDGNATMPPQKMFYNLLDEKEADYWASKLDYSSFAALNATAKYVPYTGDFRVVYVAGEHDLTIPPELAATFIEQPGAKFVVERLDSDHIPMLSRPDETVALIKKYAESKKAW